MKDVYELDLINFALSRSLILITKDRIEIENFK